MSSLFVRSVISLSLAATMLASSAPTTGVVLNMPVSTNQTSQAETTSTPTPTEVGISTSSQSYSTDSTSTQSQSTESTSALIEPTQTASTPPGVTAEDFCENADLKTFEEAEAVWNGRGVGVFLDTYLAGNSNGNETNWLDNMASYTFLLSGDPGSFGCGERDQPCFPHLDDCRPMFEQGRGMEYWVFNAVVKLQYIFMRAHENLQDSVFDSSLTVSAIAKDFSVKMDNESDILKYVSAAFGIASGVIGFGGGALVQVGKQTAAVLNGVFAAAGVKQKTPTDPSATLEKVIKAVFAAERDELDNYLALAVGGDGDEAQLPARGLVDGREPKSVIAGFFADGRFLVQGQDIDGFFSSGYEFITKKLVDIALKEYGYMILADHNYEDADSCAGQYGAFWMDLDGGRCMRLTYRPSEANKYPTAGADTINKIQDTYKINILEYFTIACDCAINGSGEIDEATIPEDGKPPQCFCNIPCLDASINLEDDDRTWTITWPISFKEVMSWNN